MKNSEKLIQTAIHADSPTLDGFAYQLDDDLLLDAVRYRIALLIRRGTLDSKLDSEQLSLLADLVGNTEPAARFSGDHPECAYLVFEGGSLYYANNAQDEVWAFAEDFITERILDRGQKEASDFPADSDEGKLIRHVSPHLLKTYYGFTCASHDEQPAWFHTPEAALRFAAACGFTNDERPLTLDDVEETWGADPKDVMDTETAPWGLNA
jgi:hypothetical protein